MLLAGLLICVSKNTEIPEQPNCLIGLHYEGGVCKHLNKHNCVSQTSAKKNTVTETERKRVFTFTLI